MTDYFEKAAVVWDKDPGRVQMARTIADAMINVLNPGGKELVMDYGTGTGNIALRIVEKLSHDGISAIEIREWSIGQDTALLPRFDAIVSSMTMHHVRDTAGAAHAFYTLLVPGGRVAIADLDSDNGEFHEEPGIAEHDGIDRKYLQQVFEQAGFVLVQFHEAATIQKISSRTGKIRDFTIFLMTAQRS
ncbi:MAG: methyltransferase domain-containing protein [Methanoregula sp.]|nr:methyltransferase domain-containing protein [Methanoregula sp.]